MFDVHLKIWAFLAKKDLKVVLAYTLLLSITLPEQRKPIPLDRTMKYCLLLCPLLLLAACGDDTQYHQHNIAHGSTATIELTAYESCGTFNFDSSCGAHAIATEPQTIDIDPPQAISVKQTSQTGTLQVQGLTVGDGEAHFETALGDVTWAVSVKEVGESQYVFWPLEDRNPKRVAYMPGTTMHIQATYYTSTDQSERLLGRYDTPWQAIDEASLWQPNQAQFAIKQDRTLRKATATNDNLAWALDDTLFSSFIVPQQLGQYTMQARGANQETIIQVVSEAAITNIVACERPVSAGDQFCLDFLIDQTILLAGKPTVKVDVINDQQCDVRAIYDDTTQRWQWFAGAKEFVDDRNLTCTFDVIIPNGAQNVVRRFEAQIKYDRVAVQSL